MCVSEHGLIRRNGVQGCVYLIYIVIIVCDFPSLTLNKMCPKFIINLTGSVSGGFPACS